ncbi:MAG: SH3 domain-containing protein [Thiogranum sp.]|nr:SH3 domain-containing protein [Thiogranum sp.]
MTPSDRVTTRLNVRSEPSASTEVVGKLHPGEDALFLEAVPHWYKVRLDDGREGFVSKSWSVKLDSQPEEQYIRLGAWNIKKLGHGSSKDYSLVSQIIDDNFDVVAILEVMQKQRSHPGYDALMQHLGGGWGGLVTDTPRPNTGSGSAEYYAILYREGTVRPCAGWTALKYYPDNDGGDHSAGPDRFAREPAYGCFEAGVDSGTVGVDFLLAAYHATWAEGNEDEIVDEVSNLSDVFTVMAQAKPSEGDLLVVGDFNLIPAILHGALDDSDRTEGSGSTLNSNGDRTTNLYDHVVLHDEAATSEMVGNAVVLNRVGMAATPKHFYQMVSDHLPVMVRVRSSGPDDD